MVVVCVSVGSLLTAVHIIIRQYGIIGSFIVKGTSSYRETEFYMYLLHILLMHVHLSILILMTFIYTVPMSG